MTKILHIFSTLSVGGYQQRFVSLMQDSLPEHQHIPYATDGDYEALQANGSDLQPIDIPNLPKNSLIKSIGQARKHLREIKPDLVLTYNWGATEWAVAARTLKIPYCVCQDGFGPDEQQKEKPRRRFLRRVAMHGAKAVVVPSMTLAQLAKRSWGIKPPRLRVIPNGINLKRFKAEPDSTLLKEAGTTADAKNIIVVAALRPEKNIGRLIEAFRKVADVHADAKLLIVGDGIGRAPLTMLAERIGLQDQVVFLGQQSNPERLLSGARIFALSSDTEQMPISVVEAMAAGLPVVSTNVGDVRRMVCEDNRPYITGLRAQDLADALIALLNNPEQAQSIGAINQEKAQADFTRDRMVASWNQLFSESAGR